MQNDISQKIDNLYYAISSFTNLNTVQEKGKFPSQPYQNPKGIHEVEVGEEETSQVREVKAVITLRSGKEVDQPTSKPKHDEGLPEPSNFLATLSPWRRREEILPLVHEEETQRPYRGEKVWDPGKLKQDQCLDGLSLSKD